MAKRKKNTKKLDLNEATEKDLLSILPNDEAMIHDLIMKRPFHSLEELFKIPRITPAKINRLLEAGGDLFTCKLIVQLYRARCDVPGNWVITSTVTCPPHLPTIDIHSIYLETTYKYVINVSGGKTVYSGPCGLKLSRLLRCKFTLHVAAGLGRVSTTPILYGVSTHHHDERCCTNGMPHVYRLTFSVDKGKDMELEYRILCD